MKSVTFENLKKQNYTMKESLRALKTNIQFCGDDICTIVVTSAMPNEGKSTVTMDLARSFSESGKRVLLIDTDMRKSVYVGRLRAVASDECSFGIRTAGSGYFLWGCGDVVCIFYRKVWSKRGGECAAWQKKPDFIFYGVYSKD